MSAIGFPVFLYVWKTGDTIHGIHVLLLPILHERILAN